MMNVIKGGKRIETDYPHLPLDPAVRDANPDLADSQHAQGFAGKFESAKGRLFRLNLLGDFRVAEPGQVAAEVYRKMNITGADPQHDKDKFRHCIGIGPRSIENADP